MTALMCLLLLAGMACGWLNGRFRDRREDFTDAEAKAIVHEARQDCRRHLDEPTQEYDLVDPGWDRSSREIHHMTVPEFTEVNAEFLALIERNWPNQT